MSLASICTETPEAPSERLGILLRGLDLVKCAQSIARERCPANMESRAMGKPKPGYYDQRWKENFEYLKKFVEREGHARVTRNHREDGFNLGYWVGNMRSIRATMPEERREALERLPGWCWSAREDAWNRKFELLGSHLKFLMKDRVKSINHFFDELSGIHLPVNQVRAGKQITLQVIGINM